MRRKIWRLLPVAISIALVASVAQAATPPKVGSSCTKAGQTVTASGKKYTCIKSGKKLLWNKGVAIAVPTAKPTATPTATSTEGNLTFQTEMSPTTVAAYVDFVKLYNSRLSGEIPNIEYFVEPHMDKALEAQVKDSINAAAKFFAKERPVNIPTRIWIAMSADFQFIYDGVSKTMPAAQLEGEWLDHDLARAKVDEGFQGGGAPGDAKDGTAVLFYNASKFSNWGDSFWSQGLAHEYVHVVQRYEMGNTMAQMLCWVREGNANYYGWMLAGRNSQAVYRNYWLQAISRFPAMGNLPDYESKPASYWTNLYVQNEAITTTQCDPWINYMMGAMAFQYLAGNYGNQKIQDFYLELKDSWIGVCPGPVNSNNNPCPGWKNAFKKVFGISAEAAYPKFGQYVADEIKWAKGKKVYWNQEALKIAPVPKE